MNSKAMLMRMLVILRIVSLLFLAGCGGSTASTVNNQPPPPPPPAGVTVTVTPSSANVQPGGVQQFTTTMSPGVPNQAVTWSVSGTGCTGASCGTIDATGKYTAPATAPGPPTVTVTATSAADPTKFGSATVTVMLLPGSSSTVADLATARFGHEATLLPNGDVLITGGGAGTDSDHFLVTDQAELFDSVHLTFTSVGQVRRVFHTATLLGTGQVLLAGGDTDGFGAIVATAELYDPLTRQLQPTGNMTSEREFHTATLLADGRVLIAGGRRLAGKDFETLRTTEIYDPVAKTFSPTGSMNQARAGHTATLLADGRVLIAGGSDNGPLFSAELYDPATGSFSATGSMIIQREGYAATLLANGKVLITGGNYNGSTAELYDPARGLFTLTGVMMTRRFEHTATLLPSGIVLLAGGVDLGHALASAELYDPATGQFAPAAALQTGRFSHTATLLSDSSVLFVGGDNGDGFHFNPLSSAEIYTGISVR